jgi:hypothetical protein
LRLDGKSLQYQLVSGHRPKVSLLHNTGPVWHVLAEGGFVLVPANAAQARNVPGRKTDVGDAARLAELLAHGPVRAGFVPDGPTAEPRALPRTREQLAREEAGHALRLRKTLEDANVKRDGVLTDPRAAGPCSRPWRRARAIRPSRRRSPTRGSARRRSGSGRRGAGG